MGPVKHTNTVSTQDGEGKWTHKIRQSWLTTALDCLEKARLGSVGLTSWTDSDSSVTGTAVHHAIETAIEIKMEAGIDMHADEVVEEAVYMFDRLLEQHETTDGWEDRDDEHQIVWIKRRKPATARAFAERCARMFAEHTLPTLVPWAIEVPFGPLRLHSDELREIVVTGTIDYLDAVTGPWDWKTASQLYKPWEKERWNVQATVYNWALRHRGFTNNPDIDDYEAPLDVFTFGVFVDGEEYPQILSVTRDDEWDRWLKRQVLSLVPLLESGADVWPRIDNGVLCSAKWCEAWDQCKGLDIKSPRFAQKLDQSPAGQV